MTRAAAIAYVEEHPDTAVAYGRDTWISSITDHLTPLPPNRLWRLHSIRHATSRVSQLVPRVADQLRPAPGNEPQPVCPLWCLAEHVDEGAA